MTVSDEKCPSVSQSSPHTTGTSRAAPDALHLTFSQPWSGQGSLLGMERFAKRHRKTLNALLLPPETAQIYCGATGLALFRRPSLLLGLTPDSLSPEAQIG